jgi:hypothetical protein
MNENRSHDDERPLARPRRRPDGPTYPPEGHLKKVRRQTDPTSRHGRLRPNALRPPRSRHSDRRRTSVQLPSPTEEGTITPKRGDQHREPRPAQRAAPPSSVSEQLRDAILSHFGMARRARIREFHDAARHGDLDTIRRMVAEGCKVNARDENGRTALHHAYEAFRLDAAKLLIKLGADTSVHDRRFITPDGLLVNVRNRYVRLLAACAQKRELVDADLEPFGVDQADMNGDTALHLACYRGQWQAVDRLIEMGADQETTNKHDLTPREYGEVGAAVIDLVTLARLFSPSHARSTGSDWTDPMKARTLYDTLHRPERKIFVLALDIAANQMEHRRGVLQVAIKLGIPGTADTLIRVFISNPAKGIAEDYLNSGSSPLEAYASNWANARGLQINYSGISTTAQWGEL